VQLTPDLLPSDILGTHTLNPREGTLSFQRGPVFSNVLLADEINRPRLELDVGRPLALQAGFRRDLVRTRSAHGNGGTASGTARSPPKSWSCSVLPSKRFACPSAGCASLSPGCSTRPNRLPDDRTEESSPVLPT
jgi:ATPase family associated with various cellular activities (AAA)